MSNSKKANILIMYPNNQTSILLGRELVIDVNNVSFYMLDNHFWHVDTAN